MKKLSKDGSVHVTNEIINSITHMAGSIFSLLGMVLLIVKASALKDPWYIVSVSIYGGFLFLMFLSSTLHHSINTKVKIMRILRLIDYLSIFPLIAGTFTPVCLVLVRNQTGWAVFGVIWGLTIAGMFIKTFIRKLPKWVTNTLYICMGWTGAVLAIPYLSIAGYLGFSLLIAGAFFYSLGFLIFTIEKPNPVPGIFGFHEIWHILVILGAFSHYIMIYISIFPNN